MNTLSFVKRNGYLIAISKTLLNFKCVALCMEVVSGPKAFGGSTLGRAGAVPGSRRTAAGKAAALDRNVNYKQPVKKYSRSAKRRKVEQESNEAQELNAEYGATE